MKRKTKKRSWKALKRGIALALVVCMTLSDVGITTFAVAPGVDEPAGVTEVASDVAEHASESEAVQNPDRAVAVDGEIDLAGYSTHDLQIYNALVFTDVTGTLVAGTGVYRLHGVSPVSVEIGDQTYQGKPPAGINPDPTAKDIPVELKDVDFAADKALTIHPVNGGKNQVAMLVKTASRLPELRVDENAKMTISLEADCTVNHLYMAAGSTVNVELNGFTLTVGTVEGEGSVNVRGAGNLNADSITVAAFSAQNADIAVKKLAASNEIIMKNARVDGGGSGQITAGKHIAITNGKVAHAALFGFDATAGSACTLTMSGPSFEAVDIVGAGDGCSAVVKIEGLDTVLFAASTTYRCDLDLTYMQNNVALEPQTDWPVHYRISKTASDTAVIGSISADGTYTAAPADGVVLPTYTQKGYSYAGWKANGSESVIRTVPANSSENLVLNPVLMAADVAVTWDMGFDPSSYTNDAPLPDRIRAEGVEFGSSVTMNTVKRFGYLFQGWDVVNNGTSAGKCIPAGAYTIQSDDVVQNESGTYALNFEAVWETELFPIRMQINLPSAEISVDGGLNWYTPEQFAAQYPSGVNWTAGENVLSFGQRIAYGETLGSYFQRVLGGYPVLRDADGNISFVAWETMGAYRADENSAFSLESGLLNQGSKNLEEYQRSLQENPVILFPKWGATDRKLTIPELPEGWTVLVNDEEQVLPATDAELWVKEGSTVSFRCSYTTTTGFSRWALVQVPSGTRVLHTERSYTVGQPYFYYDFAMPGSDMEAIYSTPGDGSEQAIKVDLAKSPIVFEEHVTYNNHEMNGFWYNEILDCMTPSFQADDGRYFYAWDAADPFYVTTNQVPTQNQLVLINSMNVHLEQCNLVATDAYMRDVQGRKIGQQMMEARSGASVTNAKMDWSPYANILIDNRVHDAFTTTLTFHGDNTVAGIFQSVYGHTNVTEGQLTMKGATGGAEVGAVALGSVFGNMNLNASNLSISEYQNAEYPDQSEYLFWLTHDSEGHNNLSFSHCTLQVPNKRLYTWRGSITYSSGTRADIGSSRQYEATRLYDTSYLRVRKDLLGTYSTVVLRGDSSLVVDGNIISTYSHWSAGANIDTNGYVVVKGNRFDAEVMKLTKGTVIANALVLGRGCQMNGGTIVTNQVMNAPCMYPSSVDANGEYTFTFDGAAVEAIQNGDNDPFLTRSQSNGTPAVFQFAGGDLYMLGHYKLDTTQARYQYDTTVSALDPDNPVQPLMAGLLDENGDLNSAASLSADTLQNAVAGANTTNATNECLVFGNSSYLTGTSYARDVMCTGTNFHAAGNMTFYNDTTISGGSVNCNVLSSKHDLTIADTANVTANEIGNAYNLTTETADKLTRWQKVDILGGTVTTGRLGALSQNHPDGTESKSTVRIAANAAVTADNVVQDVYVNYVADSLFQLPENNPTSLRFHGTDLHHSMTLDQAVHFQEPTPGHWKLDSLSGPSVSDVNTDGQLLEQGTVLADVNAYDCEMLALYAVKDSYQLIIKDGWDRLSGATVNGSAIQFGASDHSADVAAEKTVVLSIAGNMEEKTVVWYRDGVGVIHNVMPTVDTANHTLTFTMPSANTEIWITNEMELYLNQNDIVLTPDGFRLAWDATREDSSFAYRGDIRIAQEDSKKETSYRMKVEAGAGNAGETPAMQRTITLDNLYQVATEGTWGTEIADGEQVALSVYGSVRLMPVNLPQHAAITMQGVSPKDSSLYFRTDRITNYASIYTDNYKTGNVTLENLTFGDSSSNYYYGSIAYASGSPNSLILRNVTYYNMNQGPWGSLETGMSNVILDHCQIKFKNSTAYATGLFNNCRNVTIQNGTTLEYRYGTQYKAPSLFDGIAEKCTIIDSNVTIGHQENTTSQDFFEYRNCVPKVELQGNSTLTVDRRIQLRNLVVGGNSQVIVGSTGVPGYLLCENMTVNDAASVNTDYLVVSGMYVSPDREGIITKEDFFKEMEAGSTHIHQNGSLTIHGGTVTASEFVGGDRNGTITVDGGVLEAKKIGSYGAIFGYAQYIPKPDEEAVYTYAQIPTADEQTTVNVAGGKVRVTDGGYVGGMRAAVNVTGGNVELAKGAVLGIAKTELDKLLLQAGSQDIELSNSCAVNISGGNVNALAGSVAASYGTINVSGTAVVDTMDMIAEHGDITISATHDGIKNPYTGTDKLDGSVGVHVQNELRGLNVTITDGAVVYAEKAYTQIPAEKVGSLNVTNGTAAGSHLYIGTEYGRKDAGTGDITVEPGSKIFGDRQYSVTYQLNDDAIDPAVNHPDNPKHYTPGVDPDQIALQNPTRYGFAFAGWYEAEDLTGERVTSITTMGKRDLTLYAKWEPLTVEFVISVDRTLIPDLDRQSASAEGTYDPATGVFTFDRKVRVAYRDAIFGSGEGHIFLRDYALAADAITGLCVNDPRYQSSDTDLNDASTVTRAILNAYTDNQPIQLSASRKVRNRVEVIFDLNLDAQMRPVNSSFVGSSQSGSILSQFGYIDSKLSTVPEFMNGDQFISAQAPGYTFDGWYTDQTYTVPVDQNFLIRTDAPMHFYAKWTPKTYQVTFDPGAGNFLTKDQTEPTELSPSGEQRLSSPIVYDTVLDGNLQWSDTEVNQPLPHAWSNGKVFLGWSYDGTKEHIITEQTEFNHTDLATLDDSGSITLTAVYENVQVIYHSNGGEWKNGFTSNDEIRNDLSFGDPLVGCTKYADGSYGVVSTDAQYYEEHEAYMADDYRNAIMRKGYTFQGWYLDLDGTGESVATLPRFANVEVYAKWQPNSYMLNLRHKDDTKAPDYYHTEFNQITDILGFPVTVGERIVTTEGGPEWPPRNEESSWFVKNQNADMQKNQRRMVLGFTFDSFDPGDTRNDGAHVAGYRAYQEYAANVVKLQNQDLLFRSKKGEAMPGSVFRLPSDSEYNGDMFRDATVVPDYPDGSTIDMYAIYRERSLVFVEYVAGSNSAPVIMDSYPWEDWVDYPAKYEKTDNYAHWTTVEGYSLLDWRVNGWTQAADSYTSPENKNNYDVKKLEWKDHADHLGTYDIMVYTLYVPTVMQNGVTLVTTADATQPNDVFSLDWRLPNSIQSGKPDYTITMKNGLNLVDRATLNQNLYNTAADWDASKPGDQNANNTVAIEVSFYDDKNQQVGNSIWLTEGKNQQLGERAIAGGYRMVVTLYHSWVISETKDYTFDFDITFPSLPGQTISFHDMTVKMKPSQYQVTYDVELPQGVAPKDDHFFQQDPNNETHYTRVVTANYGSKLYGNAEIPLVEGYVGTDEWIWKGTEHVGYDQLFQLPVQAADGGKLTLHSAYQKGRFQLSAEQMILDNWTVTHDGTNLTQAADKVAFQETVAITPKNSGMYPEFVNLTIGEGADAKTVRLDQYEHASVNGDTYTFPMPAAPVHLTYQNQMPLYLENGTINLDPDGFTQPGVYDTKVTWRGGYQILMNAENKSAVATDHVLNLSGDLTDREISLGDLNISGDHSIALAEHTHVNLNPSYDGKHSTVIARDILVPATAEFTMTEVGASGVPTLQLAPSADHAAIGCGDAVNGSIQLQGISVDLTLPAGSKASGIGSNAIGAQPVILKDCEVNVAEKVSASAVYSGTWIGGTSDGTVLLENTVVKGTGTGNGTVLDGATVSVTGGSQIGTMDAPVSGAIHAENTLEIKSSQIYQQMDSGYAVYTAPSGVIAVSGGSLIHSAVTKPADGIYQGSMILESAADDVVIANRQILDTENGDIRISSTQVVQGTEKHAQEGGYLLIHDKTGNAEPVLRVDSISAEKNVALRTVNLNQVTIGSDVLLMLEGDVTVNGSLAIDQGKTLTVDAMKAENGLTLNDTVANQGAYVQQNGSLHAGEIACDQLDVTLTDVIADVSSLEIHNLSVTGGAVTATAPNGKVGSLGMQNDVTHIIFDHTTVTADTVGALGEQNKTFTFVESAGATIQGTLVRDLYRLDYDLNGKTDYDVSTLPTVLRGTTAKGAAVETYSPAIPDEPIYTGADASAFKNWCVMNQDKLYALHATDEIAGFAGTLHSLTADHADWAVANADGTRTLTLHAWIQKAVIAAMEEGRVFEALNDQNASTSVSIAADGAWTAMFATDAILPGAGYAFKLPAMPEGTCLTLGVLAQGDTLPVFYHYEAKTAIAEGTVLNLSAFERMGKPGEHPAMPAAYDRYLLSADFAETLNPSAEPEKTVQFSMVSNGVETDLASVTYTRTACPGAQVEANGSTVTVTWNGDNRLNGKKLYLVAELDQPITYQGTAALNAIAGTCLSQTEIAFELSANASVPMNREEYTLTLSGVKPDTYQISWKLLAAESLSGVYGNELAHAEGGSITVQADEPHMSVLPNSELETSHVFAAGQPHVFTFTVDTNRSDALAVCGEKQSNVLALFNEDRRIRCVKTAAGTWEVTLPEDLPAGTYRVRFSIGADSVFDDVCFTIILGEHN